jgi:putative endonuclease
MDGRVRLGRVAEGLAAEFLERFGMRVLARNWRRREGELDIVAQDWGTLVFVEVRSRTGEALGHPLEAVTLRKQAQVVRSARIYLNEEKWQASGFRFDVVGVTFWTDGRAPRLDYVPNAFDVAG